ncbi:general stress protein [Cryobacterium tepidiphilum]|uniref:general stress protein n=1 Tax=Cryobacterium tepidiphilum TaxID=2486026 RepID=UPI001F33EFEB|nr:general stress protein [Cryobacterium tepidiphilum]
MTNQSLFGGGRRQTMFPTMPRGEVVATYETYNEAQAAVDVLAKADFPVKQLSIVGNDLKTVEHVTGKLSWGRVAIAGAASGAWMGIFFGLLFFIFSPDGAGMPFLLAAVLIGAGFGMLFGLVSYAFNRRRRDFTSTMQVIATNYHLLVEASLVNRARNVLGGGSGIVAGEAPVDSPADAAGESPVDVPGTPGQAREAAEAREAQQIHEAHQAQEAEHAEDAQRTREMPHVSAPAAAHEDPTPPDVPAGTARPAEPEAPPAYGERTREQ